MTINVTFPFDTPGNYALDNVMVSGGLATLIAEAYAFRALYNVDGDPDANDADGDPTGTLVGGATVAGGVLDVKGAGQRCDYNGGLNIQGANQKGCLRLTIIPDYNGAMAGTSGSVIFHSGNDTANTINQLVWVHNQASHGADPNKLRFQIRDKFNVIVIDDGFVWSAVQGQTYELEANWDLDTGRVRLFLDGVVMLDQAVVPADRTTSMGYMRLGQNRTAAAQNDWDGEIADMAVFNSVQHTANYTPEGSPTYNTGTLATNAVFLAETLTAFSSVQDDKGGSILFGVIVSGTLMYWDGGAWVPSDGSAAQLNTASDIDANASTLLPAPAIISFFSRLTAAMPDGVESPELDEFTICYDAQPLSPSPLPTCEVYGFVVDFQGNPVEGAVVTATPPRPGLFVESGEFVVTGPKTATTNALGLFDLDLIRGLRCYIDIAAPTETVRFSEVGRLVIVVPDQDVANIKDLVP